MLGWLVIGYNSQSIQIDNCTRVSCLGSLVSRSPGKHSISKSCVAPAKALLDPGFSFRKNCIYPFTNNLLVLITFWLARGKEATSPVWLPGYIHTLYTHIYNM